MLRRILTAAAVALAAGGCATQQASITERDIVALNNRIEELEAVQTRLRTRVVALEKAVEQQEERLTLLSRRTSLDPREVVRIEPERERQALSRQTVEVVRPDVSPEETVTYQEIVISDEKKRAYFGSGSAYRAEAPSGATGPRRAYDNVVTGEKLPSMPQPQSPSPPPSSSPGAGAEATKPSSPIIYYQEGIDLYRRGMYREGIARFEQFMATKPETEYIDNALYWIGECYYGLEMYNEAAGYFHRIIQEYPGTNKVPDALLKVALTYQKLGRTDSAREMLRYLMDAFPGSEAARTGKEKYDSLVNIQP